MKVNIGSICFLALISFFVNSNAQTWTNVTGLGAPGKVSAITSNGNDLYVGGAFTSYGNIAK